MEATYEDHTRQVELSRCIAAVYCWTRVRKRKQLGWCDSSTVHCKKLKTGEDELPASVAQTA